MWQLPVGQATHSAHDCEKASAQSPPQARARSRALAAVLPRQFAPGAVPAAGLAHTARGHRVGRAHRYLRRDRSVHGCCGGRARGVVRADAALAGHAARHRGHRAGVWVAHAGPARRALHQAQAHHHLSVVRGRAAQRARRRQVLARDGVRFRLPSHRGGLAQADLALGAVLLRARNPQRDRLALADDRRVGELQGVRRGPADLPVRRLAISAVDAIRRAGEGARAIVIDWRAPARSPASRRCRDYRA